MSTSKRSLEDQQRRLSNQLDADIPAQKRLKSTHDAEPRSTGLASLLGNNPTRLTARLTNGVTDRQASKVDDTRAVVSSGVNGDVDLAISVSSEEDISDEEVDLEEDGVVTRSAKSNGLNGTHNEDADMADAADNDGADAHDGLSFGDMLIARHPDVITIAAEPNAGASASALQTVTGYSLGTVLQQALKTNDKDLLERCFELRDIQAVKNTIQRLPSPLIEQLLSRISERMDKRPGRAGPLLLWVQWSLVAHGGYLAGQPDILKRLAALSQVMKQRAQGLQPLLRLKGKLDLLHAQLALRRDIQAARQNKVVDAKDEGVTYREGDAETAWDDEDSSAQSEGGKLASDLEEPAQQDQSDDDDSQDEDSLDAEGMLDIEAEDEDDEEEDDSEDMEQSDNDSEGDASEASFHTSEDEDEDDDEGSAIPPRRPI